MTWRLVLSIIYYIVSLYGTFMLIYCLAGWFIRNRENKIYRFFAKIAEPPLYPIRLILNRFDYFRESPVDFSPLILYFALLGVVELIKWLAK